MFILHNIWIRTSLHVTAIYRPVDLSISRRISLYRTTENVDSLLYAFRGGADGPRKCSGHGERGSVSLFGGLGVVSSGVMRPLQTVVWPWPEWPI
jgi:hypothetical protein